MRSRYDEAEARRAVERYKEAGEDLALRVYTSRLLGAEPGLVLHGGGNTSVKSRATELTGQDVDVLFVKGSGWDLASIEPAGFPACRLEPLRALSALPTLSDEDMVRGLRSQMLDPPGPTPSVEALLHALVPEKFVDHTHADAVLAVVDQPDSEERVMDVWGQDALFVPYVMPGFVLARRIFELGDAVHSKHIMVLDKHGIFTWGATARESYERMTEAVTRAEDYVTKKGTQRSVSVAAALGDAERRARQRALSPIIRGALERATEGQKLIGHWRDEPEILELSLRADAAEQTQIGTATPDHVLRTKGHPLFLGSVPESEPESRAHIETALGEYIKAYIAYFDRHVAGRDLSRLDPLPRLVLAPGLGVLTVGKTLREANIAGDIYVHTARVITNACALGQYRPVSTADRFDVEYWSLEQAKLGKQKPGGPLARHVALVTGAAGGIGLSVAKTFLEADAHVVLADRDDARLEAAAQFLAPHGDRATPVECDVTDEASVRRLMDHTARAFGGLDVVVSNAGTAPGGLLHTDDGSAALEPSLRMNLLSHQLVAKEATRVLLAQDSGGSLLFNASKSAFNPGPGFGPYAVPKAALVALMRQYAVDLGAHGIRSNAVNADRIHTALFSDALLEERARARGVPKEEYFRQNLLRRETTAQDVAEAFLYLATANATTGTVLTVDGGNAAAFPR